MKKFNLGIAIYLTTSKFLAYVIFAVGSVFAFINKNPEVFMFSSGIAASLHGLKTWQQSSIEKTKINNGQTDTLSQQPIDSIQVQETMQDSPQFSQQVKKSQKNKKEIG
jgi:hypothetical protein